DSDGEISIFRIEKANNVITKLMQAIPEKNAVGTPKLELFWSPTVNTHTNVDNIGSDSDSEIFEDGFEIETVEVLSSDMLANTISIVI
ncbi:719_t:CDS:2, partial [Gigaspora rosea]